MSFEEDLAELAQEFGIPADRIESVRGSSKLKAERDAADSRAAEAQARLAALEGKQAADIFTKLGISGTPDDYNLPADVDRTDEAQISAWALGRGLVKTPEPEPSPDAAAHQRMDAAAAGSGGSAPPPANVGSNVAQLQKQILRAGPDQLQPGSDLYNRVLDTLQSAGLEFGAVEHGTSFERIPDWGSKTPA